MTDKYYGPDAETIAKIRAMTPEQEQRKHRLRDLSSMSEDTGCSWYGHVLDASKRCTLCGVRDTDDE